MDSFEYELKKLTKQTHLKSLLVSKEKEVNKINDFKNK